MTKTSFKKALSLTLCIVLIAVMALFTTGCNDNVKTEVGTTEAAVKTDVETKSENNDDAAPVGTTAVAGTVLGEGETTFFFKVTDTEGTVTEFEIHTDEKTVGDALVALELIAGEESEYGLYVKTVNGITLDYDTDGKYWAFYENGAYAAAGVDSTEITAGTVYEFKAE